MHLARAAKWARVQTPFSVSPSPRVGSGRKSICHYCGWRHFYCTSFFLENHYSLLSRTWVPRVSQRNWPGAQIGRCAAPGRPDARYPLDGCGLWAWACPPVVAAPAASTSARARNTEDCCRAFRFDTSCAIRGWIACCRSPAITAQKNARCAHHMYSSSAGPEFFEDRKKSRALYTLFSSSKIKKFKKNIVKSNLTTYA